jgi:hypothetical protein
MIGEETFKTQSRKGRGSIAKKTKHSSGVNRAFKLASNPRPPGQNYRLIDPDP